MFPGLGDEDDREHTHDLHSGGILELERASNGGVQVRELVALARYMMCGTGVEVSSTNLVIVRARAAVGLSMRLVDVEERCVGRGDGDRHGRRVQHDAHVHKEKSRLAVDRYLCDVCLTSSTLWPRAVLGPMDIPITVVTSSIPIRLALVDVEDCPSCEVGVHGCLTTLKPPSSSSPSN